MNGLACADEQALDALATRATFQSDQAVRVFYSTKEGSWQRGTALRSLSHPRAQKESAMRGLAWSSLSLCSRRRRL